MRATGRIYLFRLTVVLSVVAWPWPKDLTSEAGAPALRLTLLQSPYISSFLYVLAK